MSGYRQGVAIVPHSQRRLNEEAAREKSDSPDQVPVPPPWHASRKEQQHADKGHSHVRSYEYAEAQKHERHGRECACSHAPRGKHHGQSQNEREHADLHALDAPVIERQVEGGEQNRRQHGESARTRHQL
jgi:hypothetical protein